MSDTCLHFLLAFGHKVQGHLPALLNCSVSSLGDENLPRSYLDHLHACPTWLCTISTVLRVSVANQGRGAV